jgi:hypothetical protein
MARTVAIRSFVLLGLGLVLAFASGAPTATAAPVQIYLGGGATIPIDDAEQVFETGWNLRGHVQTEILGPLFRLRGTVAYDELGLQFPEGDTSTGDASFASGMGGLTIGPWLGPIRPYAGLDLGAIFVTIEQQLETGGSVKADEVKFGVAGALGAEVKLGAIGLFVEGRLQDIFTEEGFNPAAIQLEDTQLVPVTFGIRVL